MNGCFVEGRYRVSEIANYFLRKGEKEGIAITNMKLQKLVYIAQGWYLALQGNPLFGEEIQAWQHGPVIPSLYHTFKMFGRTPITNRAYEFDFESEELAEPRVERSDRETRSILDKVWEVYKGFTPVALRKMTHTEGTPWSQTYEDGCMGKAIPVDIIKAHYTAYLQKLVNNAG